MNNAETMKNLDLERYMGKWYEIGHFKFRPEASCERAIAIYSLNDDGTVNVENQCYRDGQMIKSRTATAWVPDASDKGKLLINYDNSDFPKEGDYWVHWTDYNNSIVGSPDKDKLWWLSRKPVVRAKDVESMLQRIRSFGYDTDRLLGSKGVIIP